MVRRMLRSKGKRRKRVRTPGGTLKTKYIEYKTADRKCLKCKNKIKGISKKGSKSEKRPSRIKPELCPRCLKKELIEKVRGQK